MPPFIRTGPLFPAKETDVMKKLALILLAAGALLGAADVASAQGWERPRGVSPAGDPICRRNWVFDRGWCKPLYGGGYAPRGHYYGAPAPAPRYHGGGPRYYGGGGAVPARWNHLGSAVCPENYDYHARVNACLPRY
jgi:hypothetical protein